MQRRILAMLGATTATLALAIPPASAHGGSGGHRSHHGRAPTVTTLTDQVLAPFNLDVSRRGLLVADGGANVVGKVRWDGSVQPIVGEAVGTSGVATHGRTLAYTTTDGDETAITASGLNLRTRFGTRYADTLAYETANNPDSGLTYGIENPTQCQTDNWPAEMGPVSYTGAIDSHAYSVASWRGRWIVADAGGNDLLLVDRKGNISTIAVLPPQPLEITADLAAGLGLPDCFVGAVYNFEAVPTDVEVGRHGELYVTTLPGGPEDPSFPARGSVYRVNPWNGHATQLATGLAGATNLALGKHGAIYVAEFFAGRISRIGWGGTIKPVVDLPGAVSVESGPGHSLYAGTLVFSETGPPAGSIVRIGR